MLTLTLTTLMLAWTSTVHKVQGLSLEQGVIDFDLKKQKSFEQDKCILRLVG